MIVCDAGFPIPSSAWRIDLAIARDVPDLATVLTPISEALIVERLSYADTLPEYNAPLLATIKRLFGDAELAPVKHEAILGEMAAKAKVIVRTGAFDPWGEYPALFGRGRASLVLKTRRQSPGLLRQEAQEGLMPRIFDFGGRDVERAQTVAGLRALKSVGKQAAQVTAETADEAAAAEAAGVEMVVCRAANVGRVREGSQRVFVTAALGFAEAVTADEIRRAAFAAITGGADAVLTSRGSETVGSSRPRADSGRRSSRLCAAQIDLGRRRARSGQERDRGA